MNKSYLEIAHNLLSAHTKRLNTGFNLSAI